MENAFKTHAVILIDRGKGRSRSRSRGRSNGDNGSQRDNKIYFKQEIGIHGRGSHNN